MRRGHIGIGGWRNENPRHFRPRNGGNPHFRPSRGYGILEMPRFPPPNSRTIHSHFNTRSENLDRKTSDYSDRQNYRSNQHVYQRPHQQGERPIMYQWSRYRTENHSRKTDSHRTESYRSDSEKANPPSDIIRNISKGSRNYNEDALVDHFHVNSMGDIDHRQIPQLREPYRQSLISPWAAEQSLQHPSGKFRNYEYRQIKGDINKQSSNQSSVEYTGHRPPASDHYGCNPSSVIDNSNAFSRSVDDTVDLIRKRLLNRSDPQHSTDNFENCQNKSIVEEQKIETDNFQSNNLNEQPSKKKYQKQRLTEKSNCANIKNKIVHQLFKMDKEKIHKLMDNPNSSTKFEYAISSLITESQNSFNRHLRSTAEKSLCGSSTEFIQNDNNTIYEDTFMKQMQCILDPQDTVFLEDIKPFVMAELTKALQLNEYDQQYHISEDNTDRQDDQQIYNPCESNTYNYDNYSCETNSFQHDNIIPTDYPRSKNVDPNMNNYIDYGDNQSNYEKPETVFERRQKRQSSSFVDDSAVSENLFYGRNLEEKVDISRSKVKHDLFNANTAQSSEDEDPFAELDKQYHVAVDHDFIELDDIPIPQPERDNYSSNYTESCKIEPLSPEKSSNNIDKDIDDPSPNSSLKSSLISNVSIKQEQDTILRCKHEPLNSNNILQEKNDNNISNISENIDRQDENIDKQKESETKEIIKDIVKLDLLSNPLKSTSSNSRKRSIEQRPAHRKEKRKKNDSCASESSKQILNKNIIINVNDCASKISDKCESSKSIFNLFFSKEESQPISSDKNISLSDKMYTEKHVKRKETSKKLIEKSRLRRKDSTSLSQPTSPIEKNDNNFETSIKSETKTVLKPIDMFTEQPRKINIHQAHRNTALTPNTSKMGIHKKNKLRGGLSRQLLKRHVAVQVVKKLHTKETQTPTLKCCDTQFCQLKQKKYAVKAVQTDVYIPEKTGNKSTDTFERMKEIDLEIQVLLQEKFKLYSSMETKDNETNSMTTLGMTVLNVTPYNGDTENENSEDTLLSEDSIVNDFANIPVEELEQIALESVQDNVFGPANTEKRNRRRKVSDLQPMQSPSPTTVQRKKNTKAKSPNISLIEQIITDDRPLEDIISLDDLEIPQTKTKIRGRKIKQIKKKATVKSRTVKPKIEYTIKECSVVLERADISNYLNHVEFMIPEFEIGHENIIIGEINQKEIEITTSLSNSNLNLIYSEDENVVEETIVNDLQIDMLDVSEDIVVGDNCEIKSIEDKEIIQTVTEIVSEEIILDNSQSSMEDSTAPAAAQSDECKVYDYSADENLRCDSIAVNGNADAVLALECVENNFLAACLDGNVYYFNSEGQLITTLRGSNLAVTCLTIVKEKYGITVYTGSLDSRIRYYDLETGLEKGPECNVLSPIQTMDRAWDTVFVGTRTGFVLQFECKNNMLIPVSSVKFSDQSILALRAMKEGPRKVLLVAARSENVTIKDAQTGLLLRTLIGPKMTVYTLLYEDGKVYCGTSSHQIHVFDYASGGHVGTHEGGKGVVCLRATGGLLFAGCYDGCVYVYREGEGQPFTQIRGPNLMLLSLAVVGSKIIAGYKDRSLYIWKIPLCILQEMIL